MNKRGDEKLSNKLIFYGFILIMVAIIIFGVFKFVGNTINDTTFWRGYYSKDAGLMISIGETSRGILKLNYNTNKAEKPLVFKILKDNIIEVYDYDPVAKSPQKSIFKFVGDKRRHAAHDRFEDLKV